MDSICALSTPAGRSALGVIRISGTQCRSLAQLLAGKLPLPRQATRAILRTATGEVLDEAVLIFFPEPRSFTGEDMLEISAHGNPTILNRILEEIVSRGTRLAEPGEFTRRALANGKMTIDQVESLDWVLNSDSRRGVEIGLKSKLSGLSSSVTEVSDEIIGILSDLQAQLDFSEEEVGVLGEDQIFRRLDSLCRRLKAWVKSFESNAHLLGRWTVAIVGPPNSGKSSLFNRLCGFEKAIVFDQPGTTRDFLEHSLEIRGVPVTLVDSAGVRATNDPVERLGIQKTFDRMAVSDVICWVTETEEMPDDLTRKRFEAKSWVFAYSKSDLHSKRPGRLAISAKTGDGVNDLLDGILPKVTESAQSDAQWLPLTSSRQKQKVMAALESLEEAGRLLKSREYLDRIAQLVTDAARELDQIVGEIPPSEILTNIFRRFCIGK